MVSRQHCDSVLANKGWHKTIFIGGYYARTLAACYRILGDRRYFAAAIAYGDPLLALQSFALYSHLRQWNADLESKVRSQIEWLLTTQNADGTWAVKGSSDQKRSPGVVNFLIWYHSHVRHDPRIVEAVRKFDRFLLTAGQAKAFGLLSADGGNGGAHATEGAMS